MIGLAERGFAVFVDQTIGERLRMVFFVAAKDEEEAAMRASSDPRAHTNSSTEVARELTPAEIKIYSLLPGQVLEQPTI